MHTIRLKIDELFGLEKPSQPADVAGVANWVKEKFKFLPEPVSCLVCGDEVSIQYPKESEANFIEGERLAVRAATHAAAGNYDRAVGVYERALKLAPSLHVVRVDLAMVCFELGEVEKATTYLMEALRVDPKNVRGLVTLANQMGRRKIDHPKAAELLFKALQVEPNNVWVLTSLGTISLELGLAEEALRLYKHALSVDPTTANAYYGEALAHSALNQPDAALATLELFFERATKQDARSEPVMAATRQLYASLRVSRSQQGSSNLN